MLLEQFLAELAAPFFAGINKRHVLRMRLLADQPLNHLESEIAIAPVVQHPKHLQRNVALSRNIEGFVKLPVQLTPLPLVG